MPVLTDLTGLAGAAALVASVFLTVPGVARLRHARPALLLVVSVALAFLPLAALPVAGYVRGVVGDLSLTTQLLLLRGLLRPVCGWGPVEPKSRLTLQALVALGGLALYPPALGLGGLDPYRLGYATPGMLSALFLLAVVAWLQRLRLVAACVALAVLGWAVGACESRNLWDYLIDPLVSVYGLGALLLRGAKGGCSHRREVRRSRSREVVGARLRAVAAQEYGGNGPQPANSRRVSERCRAIERPGLRASSSSTLR